MKGKGLLREDDGGPSRDVQVRGRTGTWRGGGGGVALVMKTALRWTGRRKAACFGLLLVFGLGARWGVLRLLKLEPAQICCEAMNIGASLAAGRGFADAYGPGLGPTAHTTPVYPLLLAGLHLLFRDGVERAVNWLTMGLAAGVFALMAVAGRRLGFGAATVLAAGAAGALVAVNPRVETDGSFENFLAAVAFVAYAMVASPVARGAKLTSWRCAGLGAAGGMAMLVSAVLAAPVAFSWAWIGWLKRRDRGSWTRLAVAPAVAFVVLSPWVARNWVVLGEPVLLRSNFGLELAVSNHAKAGPVEVDQKLNNAYVELHPFLRDWERARYRAMGEARYMRVRMGEAQEWIGGNAARFAWLTVRRMVSFWFRTNDRVVPTALLGALSVIGWWGLVWDWRRRRARAGFYAGMLLAYSAVYLVVQVSPRYRAPANWILFLYSAWIIRERVRRWGWLRGGAEIQ